MKLGIVGLPNVGKSTLFNAITNAGVAADNYAFCTIDPNVGVVPVPDKRLEWLRDQHNPKKFRPRQGRVERRGTRQQVPREHPRLRRDRPRCPLL